MVTEIAKGAFILCPSVQSFIDSAFARISVAVVSKYWNGNNLGILLLYVAVVRDLQNFLIYEKTVTRNDQLVSKAKEVLVKTRSINIL